MKTIRAGDRGALDQSDVTRTIAFSTTRSLTQTVSIVPSSWIS
jgi:hypothetical protein